MTRPEHSGEVHAYKEAIYGRVSSALAEAGENQGVQLEDEVLRWAASELSEAQYMWNQYGEEAGATTAVDTYLKTPESLIELEKLYEMRQELSESGIRSTEDAPLGESMHLTLMPWAAMRKANASRTGFEGWLRDLRVMQPPAPRDISETTLGGLFKQLQAGDIQYYGVNAEGEGVLRTVKEYLDQQPGEWGVRLMQGLTDCGAPDPIWTHEVYDETEYAGDMERCYNPSDQLLEVGQINGVDVTAVGVLELLACTLQREGPMYVNNKYTNGNYVMSLFGLANTDGRLWDRGVPAVHISAVSENLTSGGQIQGDTPCSLIYEWGFRTVEPTLGERPVFGCAA